MLIKRFEAPTMAEAVRRVREEFGPDALVLSTRTLRADRGLFGRFGRPLVEVTAAVDRDVRAARAASSERAGPDRSWGGLALSRALVEPLEVEIRELRAAVQRLGASAAEPTLAAEVAELRRVAADLARAGAASVPDEAAPYLAAGLAPCHARRLAGVLAEWTDGGRADREALVAALAAGLEERTRPPREDDPPVLMLVGPTGVGKTTTLAKVAARGPGRPPALVTTDAHRVGADAALRHLARELALPFEVAVSPAALAEAVGRAAGRPLLVDTAGRGPAQGAGLGDLLALRDALGRGGRVHLVLSASTKESDLRAELARYRPLAPDAVVVTKTDESGDLANVANLLLEPETPPLAWITGGQRVPDDLSVPDPLELAERVMGAPA
jgi:flagellar biosynthesis protein FlhF